MKLSKKQKEAISNLVGDLDELSDKPRRLFSSLINFADSFLEKNTLEEKERYKEVVADLKEFQDFYYKNINSCLLLELNGKMARETRKELIKNMEKNFNNKEKKTQENVISAYEDGVREATKLMAIKINQTLIEELY